MICMNAAPTCHDLPLIRMHWASTQLSGHRVLILIGHRCPSLSVDLLPVASFVCVGMDHVLSWTLFWTSGVASSRFAFDPWSTLSWLPTLGSPTTFERAGMDPPYLESSLLILDRMVPALPAVGLRNPLLFAAVL